MKLWSKRVVIPVVALTIAGGVAVGVYRAAQRLLASFEPTIRAEAIRFLEDRFQADVELKRLAVSLPKFSMWKLWRDKGRGSIAMVEGAGLVLTPRGRPDLPPLLKLAGFRFDIDLGILSATEKHVPTVYLEGMELVIPPKGERSHIQMSPKSSNEQAKDQEKKEDDSPQSDVIIDTLYLKNSMLTIMPRQRDRVPLEFDIDDLKMTEAGRHQAMNYEASLHNPKPPGWIKSQGKFGPWNADEPGDTPLSGKYTFNDADLGVFKAIAGTLQASGEFTGTLDTVNAKGEARVPNFRLKRANRPVPLVTQYEVTVDGTNGNTILKPVRARLGTTSFQTSGAIVKREKQGRRSINLKVDVPKGEIKDFLNLAMGREPFLEGDITMKFDIAVPPLDGKVKEKLILDGTFQLNQGKFLQAKVADKVEELSQRGQGKPGQDALGDTLSQLHGRFHMEEEAIQFPELMFAVPGAKIDLTGGYDLAADNIDFRGSLALDAKVSQTLTGWKRWVAKPVDPFFSKNGAGTYLKIKVTGPAKSPSFGLDRGKDNKNGKTPEAKSQSK